VAAVLTRASSQLAHLATDGEAAWYHVRAVPEIRSIHIVEETST
jgi:hypothetical protein